MTQPNILIVMTDQQRGDTVLPAHPAQLPHISRLRDEGLTFTRAYCPTPHCCPSRASFFTGLYPSQHGIKNNVLNAQAINTRLKDEVDLWSRHLLLDGYACHFLGKWHACGEKRPADYGWQEHHAGSVPGDMHGFSWEQYRDFLHNTPDYGEKDAIKASLPGYGPDFTLAFTRDDDGNADEKVAAASAGLIQSLAPDGQPWCLYVGFQGPHDPYNIPARYLERVPAGSIQLPPSADDPMQDKPGLYRRMRQVFAGLNDDQKREAIRYYYAYLHFLDDLLGQLLDSLESTGQSENTLVIFCSDHGDYLGEHGLWLKGIPAFLSAYHVPLIMRWPNVIDMPGRQVDELVSLVDIAPTILESTGAGNLSPCAGSSLLPFMRNASPSNWREALLTICDGTELHVSQRGVITKSWHYVFNGFDEDELYDLQQDPGEMLNLARNGYHQETIAELCTAMWRLSREVDDSLYQSSYATTALAPVGPSAAFA